MKKMRERIRSTTIRLPGPLVDAWKQRLIDDAVSRDEQVEEWVREYLGIGKEGPSEPALTAVERELLAMFRATPAEGRALVMQLLRWKSGK